MIKEKCPKMISFSKELSVDVFVLKKSINERDFEMI